MTVWLRWVLSRDKWSSKGLVSCLLWDLAVWLARLFGRWIGWHVQVCKGKWVYAAQPGVAAG